MNWYSKTFSQLTTDELYDFLKLRVDVFVVEQECYYSDLDDLDRHSEVHHLFCYEDSKMLGYCRILPPGLVYNDESAIGRVIVSDLARGRKLGYELMALANQKVDEYWPQSNCHISAQEYLTAFYQKLGFEPITEMYLEDNIPHIGMLRKQKG